MSKSVVCLRPAVICAFRVNEYGTADERDRNRVERSPTEFPQLGKLSFRAVFDVFYCAGLTARIGFGGTSMLFIGALHDRLLSASALVFVLSIATITASAGALPGNGHYVAGKGEIGKAGQSLTVKQSSTTGIINWDSFSIGGKNAVTFNNGTGATLNRVTGGNISKIAGSLHATGSLYLIDSRGVIVSRSGHVVTRRELRRVERHCC
jgi:filamentous hemagglutinin family protein